MKKLLTFIFALIAMTSTAFAEKDAESDYLCFEVEAGTTIGVVYYSTYYGTSTETASAFQYSFDKINWDKIPKSGLIVENACSVYLKGNGINNDEKHCLSFRVTKTFKCSGNVMSLIDGEGTTTSIPKAYCFYRLFANCSMTTPPKLPATKLSPYCYYQMFYNCTELTTAPILPATTLTDHCYDEMFYGCSSLISAPELPATSLAENCYLEMFAGCTDLTTAPKLPAMALAEDCYRRMFYGCTNLSKTPELPATILTHGCYYGMFESCSSIVSAPELPSLEMKGGCYGNMFKGCKALSKAPRLSSTNLADGCYGGMFENCKSLTIAPELPATVIEKSCYGRMFKGCTSLSVAPLLPATTMKKNCYESMFSNCVNLKTAPELPATVLETECYSSMFYGCTNLTQAPKLPANILREKCYYEMFCACNSLSIAPELPANILAVSAYGYMFRDCENLTQAPNLPSMSLVENCYEYMFNGCKKLTIAPELPATTLERNCYKSMFKDCSALTVAPKLPATILKENCYYSMFENCVSLSVAPELPATILVGGCYYNMFSGCEKLECITVNFKLWNSSSTSSWVWKVAPKGCFICPSDLPQQTISNDYIPKGWKVIFEEDTNNSYSVLTSDENVTVDKTIAKYNDIINISIKDRTAENYQLDKVLVNETKISITDYKGSFKMMEYLQNVMVTAKYSKIYYTISTDEYSTSDKTKASIKDKFSLTFADRTTEGYELKYVFVNNKTYMPSVFLNKEVSMSSFISQFADDLTIKTEYSKIAYNITADEYSNTDKTTATIGDLINVSFSKRDDSELISATYNGNPLSINNYTASFTMPAQNVEIKTEYKAVYEVKTQSEGVSVSQPTAKAGDEISITVTIKDGYTAHLYVNGVEVTLNGNLANYIMPSGKIEIKVEYVADPKTPVSELSASTCTVDVFPNPAKSADEITIKVSGSLDAKTSKILIYNSVGSIVKQIDNVTEYNRITLKSGVYTGVLITRNGKKSFRIVVN